MLKLVKATKEDAKLKLALIGLPGAGKTYSALKIGTALVPEGKVLLLDSEHKSANKYAHIFDFYHHPVEDHDPRNYMQLLKDAASLKVDCVIIDSLSHAWWKLLDIVDQASVRTQSGKKDTFGAGWRVGTPIQRQFFEEIIKAPFHIIATLRSKAEYDVQGGKVVKLGTKPEARENCEYEFDMAAELDIDHTLTITKTRCETIQMGKKFFKPGKEFADEITSWLALGVSPSAKVISETTQPVAAEEAKPAQNPATEPEAPASSPADDDLIDDAAWERLVKVGEPKGWSVEAVEKYCQAKFQLPPEDARAISYKEGRQVAGVLAKLTPKAAGF